MSNIEAQGLENKRHLFEHLAQQKILLSNAYIEMQLHSMQLKTEFQEWLSMMVAAAPEINMCLLKAFLR